MDTRERLKEIRESRASFQRAKDSEGVPAAADSDPSRRPSSPGRDSGPPGPTSESLRAAVLARLTASGASGGPPVVSEGRRPSDGPTASTLAGRASIGVPSDGQCRKGGA